MGKKYIHFKKVLPALILAASLVTTLNSQVVTQTYTYTGSVQSFTVPPCVGTLSVDLRGAKGGTSFASSSSIIHQGGNGGRTIGVMTVTPGQVLNIYVGGAGGNGSSGAGGAGGYNGGGQAANLSSSYSGGGGGGATDIRLSPYTLLDRQMVAGAGGGGAWNYSSNDYDRGGMGGGLTGEGGYSGNVLLNSGYPGGGGTQSAGGAAGFYSGYCGANTGSLGLGGAAGITCGNSGGGGGAGYYGGGGGVWSGGGGGSSYTGPGITGVTHTQGFQTGNGLAIITFSFLATNVSVSTSSAVICNGNSTTLNGAGVVTYTWLPVGSFPGANTQNITVSPGSTTTYTVGGTNSLGCISAAIITVTVSTGIPVLSISTSSNSLCLGRSATVTASGALTYTWTNSISNGVSFIPASGVNNYTVSGQNGCGISTAVTTITVAPIPVTVISTPTSVCAGSTATLTAASSVNGYTWQPSGPLLGPSVVVGPVSTTVYTVTASDGTCSGVGMVTLTTKPIPTISIVASGSTVCQGGVVTMTASGAVNYSWSPVNSNAANISDNPTGPTSYIATGSNSLGCSSSANQVVLTIASPVVNITPSNPLVCAGNMVNLVASGNASGYSWTGGPLTAAYVVNPTATTVYTVIGSSTSNTCTTTKTATVNILAASVAVAATPTGVCNGGSANLTASGANSYTWTGFPPGSNISVTPGATTIYTITAWTTTTSAPSLNCPSSNNITITVFNTPTVTIVATKTVVCKQDAPFVLTGAGATTYTWSNNLTTNTISVHPTAIITYSITGTDINGCVNTGSLQIKVNTCTGIAELKDLQNSISVYPNPSNGEFTVTSGSDIHLKIMNELGQEIRTIKLSEQNDHRISVTNLANGIYFIIGENENGKVNQKIVVTK